MKDLKFTERLQAEKTVCVLLVRGTDVQGQPICAYVGVRADRLGAFMQAQAAGNFDPEDHGLVITSGTGEPDTDTRARMETEYGFNHAAMTDIPDADALDRPDIRASILKPSAQA